MAKCRRTKSFQTRQSVFALTFPRGSAADLFFSRHRGSLSRDPISTETFLSYGSSDVTSTDKMENMFLGADTVKMNKKCGGV